MASKLIKLDEFKAKDNLSVVLHGVKDIRLEQTPIPEVLEPDQVLLETDCVGICGSDVHYVEEGRIGDFVVREPMILGHETSAIVRVVGHNVKHLKVGQRVAIEPGEACGHCDNCKTGHYNMCPEMAFHATPPIHGTLRRFFVHPGHLCFPLPDHLDSESGACVEPLSVGVFACERANVKTGDHVLICGAGPIGLLAMLAAKAYGAASICITDINEQRLKLARELGAESTVLISKQDDPQTLANRAKQSLSIVGFDITIECSGANPSFQLASAATKSNGKIVLVGMGALNYDLPVAQTVVRQITVLGAFRYANCYPKAIKLLSSNKINVKPLITHHFPIEKSVEAFETTKSGKAIKVIINCRPT